MKTSDFDYELPEELIAQTPVEPRDHSRLMVVHRATGEREDKHFYDIIDYLRPNDALVINETKVIPARLLGEKEDTGVPVEVLLLRRKNQTDWEALVRPGRRLKPGTTCVFGGGLLKCEILESVPEIGGRIVRFHYEGVFEELLDRLYEQIIEQYAYPGNYLILVYHDIYDVPSKATSGEEQDESEEIYEYILCAICPVELSKPALGYREDENRIGARVRDWVVGLPDLGFVYPAFANRGSDVNAVMYYVKTGRPSHPEFIENVLGCVAQRTAAEDKLAFKNVVHDAFGEDEEQADAAFFQMQKTISAMVAEREEDESLPPVELTAEAVSGLATEAEVPDSVRAQIEKSYEQVFGDQPPQAHNVLDSRLVEEGTVKAHTAALEQKVAVLQQELAHQAANAADAEEDDVPWETGTVIDVRMPQERAANVHTEVVEGQKCLVIPLTGDESARINGVEVE